MDDQFPTTIPVEEFRSGRTPGCRKNPLPAYLDFELSTEAAEQLVEMLTDVSIQAHTGADLPRADRAALLARAAEQMHSMHS